MVFPNYFDYLSTDWLGWTISIDFIVTNIFLGKKTNTSFRWKEGKGNVSLKTAVSEDISLSLLRLNEKGMITKHLLIMEN